MSNVQDVRLMPSFMCGTLNCVTVVQIRTCGHGLGVRTTGGNTPSTHHIRRGSASMTVMRARIVMRLHHGKSHTTQINIA